MLFTLIFVVCAALCFFLAGMGVVFTRGTPPKSISLRDLGYMFLCLAWLVATYPSGLR